MNMADEEVIEGHLVVHYQHGNEQKLMVSRTDSLEIAAYHHSSRRTLLSFIGRCRSRKGEAINVRRVFEQLQNTGNVDKVSFISAPMRPDDCC